MSKSKPEHLKDEGSGLQSAIAGGLAGLGSRFVTAPLDIVKIRLQLQVTSRSTRSSTPSVLEPTYKGAVQTFKSILQGEGVTAFWKGNIPAGFLYLCYGSIQFWAYHHTAGYLESKSLNFTSDTISLLSGAFAGGTATTLTYPLDLLRTRFAAQGSTKVYSSLASGVRAIAVNEGARGFYQGSAAAIISIIPHMGLFFYSFEKLKVAILVGKLSDFLPIQTGNALAGALASVIAKTALFPLDTVRKRLQVQGPTRELYFNRNIPLYKGIISTISTILRREGSRGLYKGLPLGLIKSAPTSAITMWMYEGIMTAARKVEAIEND